MSLSDSIQLLETRIAAACAATGRARGEVQRLAVSKTVSAERLGAAQALGIRAFGENYVQEALPKIAALSGLGIEWHHIGPIQSNKTADIAAHFDWVQGVDRLKIAQRLNDQRPPALPPLNVCVQVNISGEPSKSGCAAAELQALCAAIATLPRLHLRGLMAIPAADAPASDFQQMRVLFEALQSQHRYFDTLSMGMSDDLELAIAAGSTLLRIGSALFGARK
jgi:pyridoxal phosphate enzyme (YggS family)